MGFCNFLNRDNLLRYGELVGTDEETINKMSGSLTLKKNIVAWAMPEKLWRRCNSG